MISSALMQQLSGCYASLQIEKVFIYQYNKTFSRGKTVFESHRNKKEEKLELGKMFGVLRVLLVDPSTS
jgi:hypothetical protein